MQWSPLQLPDSALPSSFQKWAVRVGGVGRQGNERGGPAVGKPMTGVKGNPPVTSTAFCGGLLSQQKKVVVKQGGAGQDRLTNAYNI